MTLVLERPLISLDLETTGLNPREDRIVEISCVKIFPGGERQVKTRRLNPEKPISVEATEVHGISNDDVAQEPTFVQVARSMLDFLGDSDLTGFNLEHFDLPMLKAEFRRVGMEFPRPEDGVRVIDARKIFLLKEPRTLAAAYQKYCGKEIENAHSAEADALAAAEILFAQVKHYDDAPNTIDGLDEFCHPERDQWYDDEGRFLWRGERLVLGFGKHRGRALQDIVGQDPGYLRWVLQADFGESVRQVVMEALEGNFPTPPAA